MALFGLDGGLFIPIFSNKYHRSKPKYLYSDTDPPKKKYSQLDTDRSKQSFSKYLYSDTDPHKMAVSVSVSGYVSVSFKCHSWPHSRHLICM